MSSNARELSGVKLTVKADLEHFRNRVVLVETDNKVTQAYINHLGDGACGPGGTTRAAKHVTTSSIKSSTKSAGRVAVTLG